MAPKSVKRDIRKPTGKPEDAVAIMDSKALVVVPLASSFDDQIRPLLDAVDRLRQLKVMQEGIELPTIVVVGDQSSGKSSVLESLAGISLPRGQGICTRVPLVMRLQDAGIDKDVPELILEYGGKSVFTTEEGITDAIVAATDEIAGEGKGISNVPLTLVVRKSGVPDLTMVDLPGITRVPVHGQPDDIYDQIHKIIMEYISPKETIILNVLSATVDFPTCESIRMSQMVDKTGERTLAVVTKSDKSPEGLLEKVTADDVNIGLGYVCVRNRINDETYEEAREKEALLFESHPLLSKIDKFIVGVPVLAQKLVKLQASSIALCLPDIIKKLNEKLNYNLTELNQMPQNLTTISEAMREFMQVLATTKESLRKILLRGDFEDYPDELQMHGTARFAEMLEKYTGELPSSPIPSSDALFLMEEISILKEYKGVFLPNFLPRSAFSLLLRKKINEIAHIPANFVRRVWNYVEEILVRVWTSKSDCYPQLHNCSRRALQNLMEVKKNMSHEHVRILVDMERVADYTGNPDYAKTWTELMAQQQKFMNSLQYVYADDDDYNESTNKLNLKVFGEVEVGHLRPLIDMALQAFDLRMRLTAYWKIVVLRLVDGVALHLLLSIKNLVEVDLEKFIVDELVGPGKGGIERMLEEPPATARKRERLQQRVELLKESSEVVADLMDRLVSCHQ